MIPRVRLKYVQGLANVHEELRLPRDVDLTTDGQQLIVSSAASGRPLLKFPLAAVERTEVVPEGGPAAAANMSAGGLSGAEDVVVLQFRASPGVPQAVAGQPIVLADPHEGDVRARFGTLKDVLVPRTEEEMALLRKGEGRVARTYAIVFMALVVLLVLIIIAIQQLIAGPKPRDAYVPSGVALAGISVVVAGGE